MADADVNQGGATFGVRFRAGSRNWPGAPTRFQGAGQVTVDPSYVTIRANGRWPGQARVRMVEQAAIVNVYTAGREVVFHVLGVRENGELSFMAGDAATAERIAALLPTRQTEAFAQENAEHHAFHDRIDDLTPSTPVLWTLLAFNIGIYALMWIQRHKVTGLSWHTTFGWGGGAGAAARAEQLVLWGSNVARLTLHGQPWRLFTSMFLHGSPLHLLFNMLALWQVGGLIERIFGSARFSGLYVLSGLAGAIASALWNPHVNSVGASGAIFGILGGVLACTGREGSGIPPTVVRDLRGSVIPFLLFNIMAGFAYPHTDNAAHIGGLAGGWLAGHLLARSLHAPDRHVA